MVRRFRSHPMLDFFEFALESPAKIRLACERNRDILRFSKFEVFTQCGNNGANGMELYSKNVPGNKKDKVCL